MENNERFGTWDYVMFIATLMISFSIGVFFAIWDRKRDTPLNYFLAGRKYGIGPITLSYVVTFQSSLMIVGLPPEVYLYGMTQTYSVLGMIAAFIVGGLIFVPVFHPLEFTSVYRYFEARYQGNAVRYLTLIMGIIYYTFYMGSVTYGTCVALEVVIGIPFWATIILCTVVTAVYTSIGGIKAVIWSDVFQLIMMVTGIVALLGKAIVNSGGSTEVITLSANRLQMNDFRFDPRIRYQCWNVSFGALFKYLFLTCSQSGIQRIKSTSSVRSARIIFATAIPLLCLFYLLTAFQGLSFFSYYSKKGCDPIVSGRAKSYNQLVPLAVLDLFQNIPGLAGLFIASLLSGALSTLSSCLSSLSAITYDDVILVKFPNISDKRATIVSKVVALIYGIIALTISFAVSKLSGTVYAVFTAFMGCLNGPYCGIFLLSVMSRRITSKGAFTGGTVGMVVTFWLIIGQILTKPQQSYRLPPGPVDQCFAQQVDVNGTLFTQSSATAHVSPYSMPNMTLPLAYSTSQPSLENERPLSALKSLYSISYVLFSLIGFFTTAIVTVAVSLFTKATENIDERCLFSFRMHASSRWKGKTKRDMSEEAQYTEECNELMTKRI